jgi:hypothetical protein
VIYVDTDFIFLEHPGKLMQEQWKNNGEKMGGMCPCLWHYGSAQNSVPYYGQSGLNAGYIAF